MKTLQLNFLFLMILSNHYTTIAQQLTIETQSNTSCGVPNGTASASVDGITNGYSFEWHEGADVTGTVISFDATATNLFAGMYTVRAFDNATGNEVGSAQAVISDERVIPVVTVEMNPNTSCTVWSNGSLTATVTGIPADYSFEWYEGADASGLFISNSQTLDQKGAGPYTVRVIDLISACVTTVSAEITDAIVLPDVTIEISHVTSCSAPNGSLTASVPDLIANYIFSWHQDGTVISESQTVDELPAGIYRSVVTDIFSGCTSINDAEVLNQPAIPVVTVEMDPNTSCTVWRNGSLTATVTGFPTDYSFEWYEGADASGLFISNSQTLDQKGAGTYTVRVIDLISACVTTVSAEITDAIVLPDVTIEISHVTSCSAPNGSLTASVPDLIVNYDFAWYEGPFVTPDPPLSTNQTIDQLAPGTYTVSVTDLFSGCFSVVSAVVADECEASPGFSGTRDKPEPATFSYYPNPARETLWIKASRRASFALANQNGKIIAHQKLNPSAKPVVIDLSGQQPGKYILSVTEGGKTSSYWIVVKE